MQRAHPRKCRPRAGSPVHEGERELCGEIYSDGTSARTMQRNAFFSKSRRSVRGKFRRQGFAENREGSLPRATTGGRGSLLVHFGAPRARIAVLAHVFGGSRGVSAMSGIPYRDHKKWSLCFFWGPQSCSGAGFSGSRRSRISWTAGTRENLQ